MSDAKFSKLLDYETLKQQFGDTEDQAQPAKSAIEDAPEFDPEERLFSSTPTQDEEETGTDRLTLTFLCLCRTDAQGIFQSRTDRETRPLCRAS